MVRGDEHRAGLDEVFITDDAQAEKGAVSGAEGHPAKPIDPAHGCRRLLVGQRDGLGGQGESLFTEDFDGGLHHSADGEIRGIELCSAIRDHERGGLAGAVRGIALRDGVDFPITGAALVADGGIRIDVDFERSGGKNYGSDIASFHDDMGALEIIALQGDEPIAHLRDRGDGGDVRIDLRLAEERGGVCAVDTYGGDAAFVAALDVHFIEQTDDGRGVGRVDFLTQDFPCHGAVHRAGVHHDEAKSLGERARERAFSGSRRAVDGDGVVGHGREVGRTKSALLRLSLRMAARWWAKPG